MFGPHLYILNIITMISSPCHDHLDADPDALLAELFLTQQRHVAVVLQSGVASLLTCNSILDLSI